MEVERKIGDDKMFSFKRQIYLETISSHYDLSVIHDKTEDIRIVKNVTRKDVLDFVLEFLTEHLDRAPVHGMK